MNRRMSTARFRHRETIRFSLFPFLAVLICTMGALILLLVVIAWQSRLRADEDLIVKTNQAKQKLRQQHETVRSRIDALKIARNETDRQLIATRLELGNVEEHQRLLREQFRHLVESLDQLDSLGDNNTEQRQRLEAEIVRLKSLAVESAELLAKTEKKNAVAQVSHAVVPYEGAYQTHRRPIYLECRSDRLILQPEGLTLEESDFVGPVGSGSLLDAALRAVREYLLSRGQLTSAAGTVEPYPLLLVRPSGIQTYYLARQAMQSWGSEFGYELIGEDWDLEFKPPDLNLAVVLNQVLEISRKRQAQLIAAAPRAYDAERRPRYRAAPYQGSVVRVDGSETRSGRPDFQQPGGAIASDQFVSPEPSTTRNAYVDSARLNETVSGERTPCLAKVRGRNWGLPDVATGSVPISRPIHIDCYTDRIVIVPGRRSGGNKIIPMSQQTQQSIDRFVSAIWEVIETWGIAGDGMYWEPVLNIDVASNAERRFQDLAILLDDSGLNVRRMDGGQ